MFVDQKTLQHTSDIEKVVKAREIVPLKPISDDDRSYEVVTDGGTVIVRFIYGVVSATAMEQCGEGVDLSYAYWDMLDKIGMAHNALIASRR